MTTSVHDIRIRIRQLDVVGTTLRHAVADAEQLADAGDIAGATAALDAVELAAYPALAVSGGGDPVSHGFRIYHAGGSGVTYSFPGTSLEFDTASFDTDGYFDADVLTTGITVPAGLGGLYFLSVFVDFDRTPIVGSRSVGIKTSRLGASIVFSTVPAWDNAVTNGGEPEMTASTLYPVRDGDTASPVIQVSVPGGHDFDADPLVLWDDEPSGYYFAGFRLGPLPDGFAFP